MIDINSKILSWLLLQLTDKKFILGGRPYGNAEGGEIRASVGRIDLMKWNHHYDANI